MVNIYLFGKQYSVPDHLTIMRAMEYAGYQLIRGCGCRNGFCGACATIYRIKGEVELHVALAAAVRGLGEVVAREVRGGAGAHVEGVEAEVHGVGAGLEGGF